jgi:predicted HTH transcriptional regulator
MTEKQLKELLKQKESTTLEYKSRIDNPYKIARTIAAFSNTSGGRLLVGVNDDKSVKGCSELEEMTKIITASQELVSPPVSVSYTTVNYENYRKVLIITILESEQKPHEVIDAKGVRSIYVRANDESVPVSKEMIQVLQQSDNQIDEKITTQPNVKSLISYLRKNQRINAKDFAKLVNISAYRASKLLESLTYAGILLMLSKQRPIQFVLKK